MSVRSVDPDLRRLRELIDMASRVVVFTGAGISTESGIPDFRSPGGVWSRNQPVYFDEFVASADARRRAWQQKLDMHADFAAARPNRGHVAIAQLVAEGKCTHVITQNIDGLHQESGIEPDRIIELHGNGTYATCLACNERHELQPILDAFAAQGTLPVCRACGGLVKTATISFGQAMPEEAMQRAEDACRRCDLFLAIGSSLVVFPAAGFPAFARQRGARLVIINRDPTDLDDMADLVLHREIGVTLGAAVGVQ